MQLNMKSSYGLRAMVFLANAQKICSVREISQKENIPFDFLEKIFSNLQKDGLIKSSRGAKGGYILAKPSREINMQEIDRKSVV